MVALQPDSAGRAAESQGVAIIQATDLVNGMFIHPRAVLGWPVTAPGPQSTPTQSSGLLPRTGLFCTVTVPPRVSQLRMPPPMPPVRFPDWPVCRGVAQRACATSTATGIVRRLLRERSE